MLTCCSNDNDNVNVNVISKKKRGGEGGQRAKEKKVSKCIRWAEDDEEGMYIHSVAHLLQSIPTRVARHLQAYQLFS